jgi:hypothetical protein
MFSNKSILKKKSLSEIMLQRSLSSSSLLKRAAAAVHAQYSYRLQRPFLAPADAAPVAFSSTLPSGHPPSLFSSVSSSVVQFPRPEKKHIHFDEQVEQCIASSLSGPDGGANYDNKIVVTLSSTTLKRGEGTPELHEGAVKPSEKFSNGSQLSSFPSAEESRLSKPSTRIPLKEEDDIDLDSQHLISLSV